MRTLLLFPPAADAAHPPLGIASLAGFLCENGEDVSLLDLNIRAYNRLLSAEYLTHCSDLMESRIEHFEAQRGLEAPDLAAYRATAENLLSSGYLIEHIDEARERLRDPTIYNSRSTYAAVTSIVRRAMEFVSAAHHPAQWSAGGFSMSYKSTRSADVLAAINDREQNLFVPFFEEVLSEIVAQRPEVVGISLNYYGQMIPAMTLAAMVKKHLPEAFLVVGGGLVCFFEWRWEILGRFRAFVDGWIPFEGERPLLDLVQALKRGTSLDEVSGLLRFDEDVAVYRPPGPPPDVAELPPPNFDGLPLHEYLAPEPILPLLASRGCYWGRCAFCAHAHLYRERFRSRTAREVVDSAGHLTRRYGANCFYFVDEAIPPRLALEFADTVAANGLPYRWFGEARFERYFNAGRLRRLHQGGCRMLIFGLESGATRVLDLMDKGISPDLASHILSDCTDAGIRTFVMFFAGFPTETRGEAERTVEFVEAHRDRITHVASGQFVMELESRVFRDYERYGIASVCPYPDDDLKTWWQYCPGKGMTSSEAAEFASATEQRPAMRSPDFYLLSRSHLVFLPPKERPEEDLSEPEPANMRQPPTQVPRRRQGLVPRCFAFNLDEVQQRLQHQPPADEPLGANPTQYVFAEDREVLIDVGPDGVTLLKACSGEFTLAEILAAMGEKSREPALRFFDELEHRRFIEWEQRT